MDKQIEQVVFDLLDKVVKKSEETSNALSLLQNFVIKQTPITTNRQTDLNNDEENINQNPTNEKSSNVYQQQNSNMKSDENPLVSLEKMLSYPTTTIQSLSITKNDNGTMSNLSTNSIMTIKKKKFDKYRLFAEKMLRSTLS
jgi:hypothetical protein